MRSEVEGREPPKIVLFDFAADAATLRANGQGIAQQVRCRPNAVWSDLAN